MDTQAQEKNILEWLQLGHTLTPLEALQKFGCLRLSARIYDLRDKGHDVITFREKSVDKNGREKIFARYALRGTRAADILREKEKTE